MAHYIMFHSNRRDFLKRCFSTSCGYSATLLLAPVLARQAYGRESLGDTIGARPFGRIEKISDGVYALISTPFTKDGKTGDLATHSNGGLIVGKDSILAIDSYRTPAGAKFMAEACLKITGRLPTHIVNTHFHFDHLGGTRGFIQQGANPEVIMTQTTRKLAFDTYSKTLPDETNPNLSISTLNKWGGYLTDASKIITDESKPLKLDLGGRSVSIIPMSGHTNSDLIVTDDSTGTTFAGDLIWDGIFPNFMSSSPSQWAKSVKNILSSSSKIIVPGHGSLQETKSTSTLNHLNLLDEIEKHARTSFSKGNPADAAAKAFKLPDSLKHYKYFRTGFHELAMDAWQRELGK